MGAWLQGGLLEASWGPPGGPLGPSKSCCKNWGVLSPRASLTCKTQVKLHVGPLSVPAGGLRTFWTNGPSVFLIFEDAWKSKEEPRRAMTWQAQGAEASSKLPRCIFSEWSLHFHHFEARKGASWSLRCRNHCNVCQKLATSETRKTQGPFANSGSWGLLGASWGPLGGLLGASWGVLGALAPGSRLRGLLGGPGRISRNP